MRAFEPAELWATKVTPMRMEIPSGGIIEEGSRTDYFVRKYRWRWLANLSKGWCKDEGGALWFFKVRP
jgi:hypothetical protein